MKKYFSAKIKWISLEDGGRKKIPPEGTRYCPIIKIDNQSVYEDWSIDFTCPNWTLYDTVKFCFLIEDAPVGMIRVGSSYNLYEGKKKVAVIKIIE